MSKKYPKSGAYWDTVINRSNQMVLKARHIIRENEYKSSEHRHQVLTHILVELKDCALATYSCGRPEQEIKDLVEDYLLALRYYFKDKEIKIEWIGSDEVYQILSLSYLLEVESEQVAILQEFTQHFGYTDPIWGALFKATGLDLKMSAEEPIWPKAYGSLCEALTAPKDQKPALVADFLKHWYKRMAGTGWHDSHKSEFDAYFGYWAFAAPAVVRLCGIDDSSFRDHENYPDRALTFGLKAQE